MGQNLLKLKWDEICQGTTSVTAISIKVCSRQTCQTIESKIATKQNLQQNFTTKLTTSDQIRHILADKLSRKKRLHKKNFQVSLETTMKKTCTYKYSITMKLAYSTKNRDVATKPTIFEQTPIDPKTKIILF